MKFSGAWIVLDPKPTVILISPAVLTVSDGATHIPSLRLPINTNGEQ